jgi:hypothetical protein
MLFGHLHKGASSDPDAYKVLDVKGKVSGVSLSFVCFDSSGA